MLSAVIVIPTHAAKTITMAANVLKKYHTERFATVYLLWLKLVTPFRYWLIISYVFVYSKLEAGGEETFVESIIKCRRNRYGFSCIIFLSEGRRKEVKTLNGYSYLTLEQRREIERMYAEGERVVDIAARLKRSAAAIYEELKRGYTGEFDGYARPKYSADLAQATVQENFRRRGNRRGANC